MRSQLVGNAHTCKSEWCAVGGGGRCGRRPQHLL